MVVVAISFPEVQCLKDSPRMYEVHIYFTSQSLVIQTIKPRPGYPSSGIIREVFRLHAICNMLFCTKVFYIHLTADKMTKPCLYLFKSHHKDVIPHLRIFFTSRPAEQGHVLGLLLSCWEVIFRGQCFALDFNFLQPNTP